MSPVPAGFELLRFEAWPASAGVALVELDGRFFGAEPDRPRLLVESRGRAREMPAISVGLRPWSASFAVPLDVLSDPEASFSLVPGRGPLIGLPEPEHTAGGEDRYVHVARTANDLRRRIVDLEEEAQAAATRAATDKEEADRRFAEAQAAATRRYDAAQAEAERRFEEAEAAAAQRLAEVSAERDHLASELETTRAALAEATARAEAAERSAAESAQWAAAAEETTRTARADAERERDEARAEADAAADEAERLEARVLAAEDGTRRARRELRDARAELEAVRRESRMPHAPAAAAGAQRSTRIITDADVEDDDEDDEDAPSTDPDLRIVTNGEDPRAGDVSPAARDLRLVDEPAEPEAFEPLPPRDDLTVEWAAGDADTAPTEPVVVPDPTQQMDPVVIGDADTTASLFEDDLPLEPAQTDETPALDPAAVGARLIRPAEVANRRALDLILSPRVVVVGLFTLLVVLFALIILGAGPF